MTLFLFKSLSYILSLGDISDAGGNLTFTYWFKGFPISIHRGSLWGKTSYRKLISFVARGVLSALKTHHDPSPDLKSRLGWVGSLYKQNKYPALLYFICPLANKLSITANNNLRVHLILRGKGKVPLAVCFLGLHLKCFLIYHYRRPNESTNVEMQFESGGALKLWSVEMNNLTLKI